MLFGEDSPPSRCPNSSRNDVPGVWPSPSQINSPWVRPNERRYYRNTLCETLCSGETNSSRREDNPSNYKIKQIGKIRQIVIQKASMIANSDYLSIH